MSSRDNRQAGFSLLEMVATIGILLVISVLLVPNFTNVHKIVQKVQVEGASKMLSSDIRRIQSLSRIQGGSSDTYRMQINFNNNSYYILKNSSIIKIISLSDYHQGVAIYGRFVEIAFSASGAPSQSGVLKIYSNKYPEIFKMVEILPVSGRVGVY